MCIRDRHLPRAVALDVVRIVKAFIDDAIKGHSALRARLRTDEAERTNRNSSKDWSFQSISPMYVKLSNSRAAEDSLTGIPKA